MSESPATGGAVTLSVAGMTCPTCEDSLRRALGRVPGVRSVQADHRAGRVEVRFDPTPSEEILRQAVEDAGYDLEGIGTR